MSQELARACPEAIVVCIAPDICLTPSPGGTMEPIPYMIVARLDIAECTNPKHLIGGYPAFTIKSRIPRVEGNEEGTGGGIISGVNRGYCRPLEHSTTYKSGGEWIVREGDLFAMNCAGPEGPANTYGRLVIANQVAAAPSVPVSKVERTVVDQATGEVVTEIEEVTRDPITGALTETRQRTTMDPKTGRAEVMRADVTTHADGRRTYAANAGTFDPETKTFAFKTTTGEVPADAGEIDADELAVDEDGRLYLEVAPGEGEAFPAKGLDDNGDIADDDPEILNDPEVKAALAEQAANEAALETSYKEIAWESAKISVDVVGLFDPTPATDLVGAAMALIDGDWAGAGLSTLGAAVPFAGDALAKPIKGTRAGIKLAKLNQKLQRLLGKRTKIADTIRRAKQRIKEAIKKRKAGGAGAGAGGPAKPKSPGDGGYAPKKVGHPGHTVPTGKVGGKPRGKYDTGKGVGIGPQNQTADKLAAKGYDVEMSPPPNGTKKPDYKIEGRYFDCYTPQISTTTRNKAGRELGDEVFDKFHDRIGVKVKKGQADRVVINLDQTDVTAAQLQGYLRQKPVNGLAELIAVKGDVILHIVP